MERTINNLYPKMLATDGQGIIAEVIECTPGNKRYAYVGTYADFVDYDDRIPEVSDMEDLILTAHGEPTTAEENEAAMAWNRFHFPQFCHY